VLTEVNGVQYKLCPDCNEVKPTKTGFYRRTAARGKKALPSSYCKQCTSRRHAAANARRREIRRQVIQDHVPVPEPTAAEYAAYEAGYARGTARTHDLELQVLNLKDEVRRLRELVKQQL
jgi:hypothetical protein